MVQRTREAASQIILWLKMSLTSGMLTLRSRLLVGNIHAVPEMRNRQKFLNHLHDLCSSYGSRLEEMITLKEHREEKENKVLSSRLWEGSFKV